MMQLSDERRRLSIIVDYLFGRNVSKALPREGMKLVYSRRSGRVKLVYHNDRLFATVRPNGSMALSVYGASILSKSRPFLTNCVTVDDDAVPFVKGGKSVFCKFVTKAGSRIRPRGDVAVLDKSGRVIGVGTSMMAGQFIQQFKTGAAVKVREGLGT
jgi:predicted RNA-binding protein (TIGR00451 family)